MGNSQRKKVFNYIQEKAFIPVVLAVLVALPSRVYAVDKVPSPINKMDSSSYEDKIQSSSNLQKGSYYLDSITKERFEIRFHSIDFRTPTTPNNIINVQVVRHIWNDGVRLYHGLIYLEDRSRTAQENEQMIKFIFRKNIEADLINFQFRINPQKPPVFLSGMLRRGGQQPVEEVLPIKVQPKVARELSSSLLTLGGVLLLGTGGIALGVFYAQQTQELTALRVLSGQKTNDAIMLGKILGLFQRRLGYSAMVIKMYRKALHLTCDKSLFVWKEWLHPSIEWLAPSLKTRFIFPGIDELCRNLETLQLLDKLVYDQIYQLTTGTEWNSPTLLYILKPIIDEHARYFKELLKQYKGM